MLTRKAALPLLILLAAGPAAAELVEVPTPNMGGSCDDLDTASLAAGIDHEAPLLLKRSATERWKFGALEVGVHDYVNKTLKPLADLARQGGPAMCAGLAKRFRFFRDTAAVGKFTIYNNPLVKGSRTKQGKYLYPLYKRPPGALASSTTAAIIDGGLDGKSLELVFLEDPILAMRIHIEGSATVMFEDGTMMFLGTDGANGQQYATMHTGEGIRELKKGVPQFFAYWKKNPKYIFFKEKKAGGGGGKFGELIAGRSVAIDPTVVPMGGAAWIRTDKPGIVDGKLSGWFSYGRVALLQDTGSAIKGGGRVDVYYGTGDYADSAAKQAARPGEIYMLLAK